MIPPAPSDYPAADWRFVVLPECASTFDAARRFPAWTAVRAVRQTNGRGRFNRTWFGEPGGMWATFNIPLSPPDDPRWALLPLVAGIAIMRALRPYAIPGLRLRWPNDVLVGRSKLAGILVERPQPALGSIGIGLNMFNDIASLAPRVQDPPARLADLLPPGSAPPSVEDFTAALAGAIHSTLSAFAVGGLPALAAELQAAWGSPRRVALHTDSAVITGTFLGIAPDGSPILSRCSPGTSAPLHSETIPAISVNRLVELQ